MAKSNNGKNAEGNKTYTQGLTGIGLDGMNSFVVQYNLDVNTPSAGEFTAAVSDVCTKAAHGMATGLKVQLTSVGTLPGGLSLITDYFVVAIDENTFNLASSLANAIAGTVIDITSTGTGTHTITPTSIAGGVLKMQESVDGTNWYDISGLTTNITVDVVGKFEGTSKHSQIRPHLTLTAGQILTEIKYYVKE